MNDKQESKKKKHISSEIPIHLIRSGSVTASVWRRMSPAGYEYFDYSLARSWQNLSSGNNSCSRNFFAKNRNELMAAIDQVTQWITEQEISARKSLAE